MDRKLCVLFVGETNSCRSQMAEGLLRHLTGDRTRAASAGLAAGSLHPAAVAAMGEIGVDISSHRPQAVVEAGDVLYDLVVTFGEGGRDLTRTHHNPDDHGEDPARAVRAGVPAHLHWPVADPTAGDDGGSPEEACRGARDAIHARLEILVEHGYLDALYDRVQQSEAVLDALHDGLVIHDDGQRIQGFNRAAERMTGFHREAVIGRHCHEVFGPGGICGGQCDYLAGTPEEFQRREREGPFVTRQGEDRLFKMVVSRDLRGEAGRGRVVAAIRNVTELVKLRSRQRHTHSLHGMTAISASMQEVFESIRLVSASDYPTLILGDSGTGKELTANAIHNESRRKGGPFVPINCGALPENILESELFGHVRGAFTGAIREKKGRFELADGGTLFLDEVGELSPAFQVRLLRVLQEKRFEKVGGERSIKVDVRIVSATARDLRQMVVEGEFREDLFYRLCVVPITLPPLRDRREDIPLIIERVLEQIRSESGKDIRTVSDDAMRLLMGHAWPGNVRELINALQFASVRCQQIEIEARHLSPDLRRGPEGALPGPLPRSEAVGPEATPPTHGRRRKLTVESVREALDQTGGNKVKAAQVLGVGRATLYRFLTDHPVS